MDAKQFEADAMVKKIVYPAKRTVSSTPYGLPGTSSNSNSSSNQGQSSASSKKTSIFSKFKQFFIGTWSNQGLLNQTDGSSEDVASNNQKIITEGDPSSNVPPFHYPAPDVSFISNISSRKAYFGPENEARDTSTPNSTFNSANNNSTTIAGYETPKAKLIKYMNKKGISELEAEGILSIAKQIDNEGAANSSASLVDFLATNNKYQPYLKLPKEQEEKTDASSSSKSRREDAGHKDARDVSVFASDHSKIDATSFFSANNTAINNPDNSVYQSARRKRVYSYSEIPSPFRINANKKPKNKLGKSISKINESSTNNNQNIQNGQFERQHFDTTTNVETDEPGNLSTTASAILSILDSNEKKTEPQQSVPVETNNEQNADKSKEKRYEIFINPYTSSGFSKINNTKSKLVLSKQIENTSGLRTPTKGKVSSSDRVSASNSENNQLLSKVEQSISFDKSPSFNSAPSSTPFGKSKTSLATPDGQANSYNLNSNENGFSLLSQQVHKYKPSKSSSLRAELKNGSSEDHKNGDQQTNASHPSLFGKFGQSSEPTTKIDNNSLFALNPSKSDNPTNGFGNFEQSTSQSSIFGKSNSNGDASEKLSMPAFGSRKPTQIHPKSMQKPNDNVELVDVSNEEDQNNSFTTANNTFTGSSKPYGGAQLAKLDDFQTPAKNHETIISTGEKKESKQVSPLVNGSFNRLFIFPKSLKQEFSLSDIDELQVEKYKKLFLFN